MIVVFNMTASAMELFINDGQVQAPEKIVASNGYTAYPKAIGLQKFREPQVFGIGLNDVVIRYKDFVPPMPSGAQFSPTIPDSISTDFLLYLFGTGAILMRTSGEQIETFYWPVVGNDLSPVSTSTTKE